MVTSTVEPFKYSVEEKDVLRRVADVFQKAMMNERVIISGSIDYTDPADTAGSVHQEFKYCRKDNMCYYKTDSNEVIALEDVYVVINHTSRQIYLAPPRKVEAPLTVPNDSLINTWQQDGYKLTMAGAGEDSLVQLKCDNHISCKLYGYKLNFTTGKISEINLRMTDLDDPLNPAADKVYHCPISRWEVGKADDDLFVKHRYLIKKDNGYVPAKQYADYELINKL
ncbi:MAG: hypothetical protein JO154_20940 [Chitinophaga sp.]|uniref:hypothetical protein n=1 Tax=Chitinophaga sp. TaxID=1869181 RepID=UPI0025BD8CBA|nr:hypothetical protein [Chitinophaga sp.]MBV8255081.1 hypothetical protein [Chitinophaga sp.]